MNFTLPAGVTLDSGLGGLPRVSVATDSCTGALYLHGAHLCRWQPRHQREPVLWMSQASRFEAGAPIRGGVPICYPWFGPKPGEPSAPGHGIARLAMWTLEDVRAEPDGTIVLMLTWASGPADRGTGIAHCSLAFEVRLGATLSMSFMAVNGGSAPFSFEEALHTYFAVRDVRQVTVEGLAGAAFLDKTDGMARKIQSEPAIVFSAETDRLYLDTAAAVTIRDPGFGRSIRVAKHDSLSTVVWNPWIAKSRAMSDFGDDEWPGMLCVETANAAANAVTLPPGGRHTMTATIEVA
jgi:glucose-6-phosphate 1-epimerase